eukprot:COSAG02_NODE_8026_length_2742_cov_6.403330_4_plen_80_part_01
MAGLVMLGLWALCGLAGECDAIYEGATAGGRSQQTTPACGWRRPPSVCVCVWWLSLSLSLCVCVCVCVCVCGGSVCVCVV